MTAALLIVLVPAPTLASSPAPTPAEARERPAAPGTVTEWRVYPSMGLDAALLLGALSGDVLQADHYGADIERIRGDFSADALASLERIGAFAKQGSFLAGPFLALVLSAGETETLAQVTASARDPEARLRPGWERSVYWNADQWPLVHDRLMPDVLAVLLELERTGFPEFWRLRIAPVVNASAGEMRTWLGEFDLVPEQQRLLGRPLEPRIDIVLLHYNQPYGVRVIGQRFVSHHSWDREIQLRTAAHEIFHPPFDLADGSLLASLEELRNDPWMRSIVEDHDPSFGYNSFEGVLDEDSASVLDQLVAERLGFARDPAQRWQTVDDGMHMLAAALYHLAHEDGFADRGGDYSRWLASVIERSLLAPDEVRRRAALVVGEAAVAKWWPGQAEKSPGDGHGVDG